MRRRLRHAAGFDRSPRLVRATQTLTVFALISVTWIFFRAESLTEAMYIVTHLGRLFPGRAGNGPLHLGLTLREIGIALSLVAALFAIEFGRPPGDLAVSLDARPAWVRWSVYYAVIALTIGFGVFTRSQFLYFQF
jgi:hypothetical protein